MRQLVLRIVLSVLLHTLTTFSRAQTWEAVNPPLNLFNGTIFATTVDVSGHIYAGGGFKNGSYKNFVAVWNGTDWTEPGAGATGLNANSSILTLASYGDTVYAAGAFTNRSSQYYVAKWNGSAWSELDRNSSLRANGFIYSLAVDRSGNVYAAGSFTDTTGKYYVAKWDGTARRGASWELAPMH
ncbi:hypothetical protein OCK74_17345 [Chitinophagaceae bacterium LB-8]|uniref:Uncharacterized protein n=1 Tax=Paraflavisolibacter caeni TaxID=2982496 RepID=A0A9X2XPH3_9BACT|nr:hypothetical protein [Paraflavisolibacter caeni]MCU7550889.1 hypothetical protein [Paraflavisolibacter caeni]